MPVPLVVWEWPESAITIALVIVLALIIHWVFNRAIRLGVAASLKRSQDRSPDSYSRAGRILSDMTGVSNERHQARTKTVGSVLRSINTIVSSRWLH